MQFSAHFKSCGDADFKKSEETIFSCEEIDVLACLLGGKGLKASSELLLINPKMVELSIHSIMVKLGCNSPPAIAEAMQESPLLHYLEERHLQLIRQKIFRKSLRKIASLNKQKPKRSFVFYGEQKQLKFFGVLCDFCKSAGVDIVVAEPPASAISLVKFSSEAGIICKRNKNLNPPLLFVFNQAARTTVISQKINDVGFVDFFQPKDCELTEDEHFYKSTFDILEALLPDVAVGSIATNFLNLRDQFSAPPSEKNRFKKSPFRKIRKYILELLSVFYTRLCRLRY